MKRIASFLLSVIAWFAVTAQYYLILENSPTPKLETTLRFFSYFTILTNSLVALCFTWQSFHRNEKYIQGLNQGYLPH